MKTMAKGKKGVSYFRSLFIIIQVALTVYFILDAYSDWNEFPIVTSGKLEQNNKSINNN